tara:strand:- start:8628 stop:8915 length:288 start_codon:yes stop_codon:yes gene_type:complete
MDYLDYIIDFDRVNELTVNEKIDQQVKEGQMGGVNFSYRSTRRVLYEYLDKYKSLRPNLKQDDRIDHIVKTLHYNKILISPADIRDKEIEKVLKD